MPKTTHRTIYTASDRARFVIGAFRSKSSNSKFCLKHNIPESNLYRWQNIFIQGGTRALTKSKTNRSKKKPPKKGRPNEVIELKKLMKPPFKSAKNLSLNEKREIIDVVEKRLLSKRLLLKEISVSRSTYYRWREKFLSGEEKIIKDPYVKKADRQDSKDKIFEILHSPPSSHGFNRTSWKFDDLLSTVRKSGVDIGRHNLRKIIKKSGYRWLKARKVLTSNDPDYREKLDKIHKILGSLTEDEAFFSIDEYGPFSIKKRGGKKLIEPGKLYTVPQWQKSKGVLIMTAALEIQGNQVTHFYSEKKNTDEMIKLMNILIKKYKNKKRIFLSWDAASWHISKKLFSKIEINNKNITAGKGVIVEVAPLPAGAQFLNIIESIFSGMSRAIIHHSNYKSKDEAIKAIDRYFKERNDYFQSHPKRAGNKIWGKEIVKVKFSESQNCKDTRYR